jgi:hypothetical protein
MNSFQYTLASCHLLSIVILVSTSYAQQGFYLVSNFPQTQANNVPAATTIKLKFNHPLATEHFLLRMKIAHFVSHRKGLFQRAKIYK